MKQTAQAENEEHGKTKRRRFEHVYSDFVIVEEDEGSEEGNG